MNRLVDACSQISHKPLLLVVDDLEKSMTEDSAREIFINRGGLFREIRLRMLLTAPIILNYIPESTTILQQNFYSIIRCPMMMVMNSDRTPNEEGITVMKKIVHKRVDKSLIADDILREVIIFSGGVLRDLFKMLVVAASSVSNGDIIELEHIQMAKQDLQEGYERVLNAEDGPVIKSIYDNPRKIIDNTSTLLKLMSKGVVIEYNGKQWRGIAPSVVSYLNEQNLL